MRESDVDQLIASKLRARRLLLDFSQDHIACELNLSPQQIHKYETCQSRIYASRLARLAEILKVPVAYFYNPLGTQGRLHDDLARMLSEPNAVAALKRFSRLPQGVQTSLLDLLESFDDELAEVGPNEHREATGRDKAVAKLRSK